MFNKSQGEFFISIATVEGAFFDLLFNNGDKWERGAMVCNPDNISLIMDFKDWRKVTRGVTIEDTETRQLFSLQQTEIHEMLKAVKSIDKRIKIVMRT